MQQLNRVVRNAFQEEINRRNVRELLSSRRDEMMADVKKEELGAVRGSKPWGIDVTDVRITRIDYAESITSDVYRRMEAERERVAKELRATGAAEGEQIRAEADRQREVILADAYVIFTIQSFTYFPTKDPLIPSCIDLLPIGFS